MIKFSLVIPCFNDAVYIEQCLNSIISQNPGNFDLEVIFVDDGTPDNSCYIEFNKFNQNKNNFFYFKKNNGGLSSARNYGIIKSTGDYVVFLDVDDILEVNFLKNIAECIIHNKLSPSLFVTSYKYFCDSEEFKKITNKKRFSFLPPLIFGRKINLIIISASNCFPVCTCVIPRDVFSANIKFDENLHSLEDWGFWIDIVSYGTKIIYCSNDNESSALIRVRSGMMRNYEKMLKYRNEIIIKKKLRLSMFLNNYKYMFRIYRFFCISIYLFCSINRKNRTNKGIANPRYYINKK